MASDSETSGYRIEPLGRSHDRSVFTCGIEALDRYLHRQAGQDAHKKVAAPFVLIDPQTNTLAGYYTLSATSIHLGELPAEIARKLPRYPQVPATLLGRLAVDQKYRGQGLGEFLLMDALYRSWLLTGEIASAAVVVEAINEPAWAFYRYYKFLPFLDQPNRLFLPMTTIDRMFAK